MRAERPRVAVALLAVVLAICSRAGGQTSRPGEPGRIYKTHAEFLKLAQEYPIAQRILITVDGKPPSAEQKDRILQADRLIGEAENDWQAGDYMAARSNADEAMQICREVLGPTHYLSITATGARRLYGAAADLPPDRQETLKKAEKFAADARRAYNQGNYMEAENAAKSAIDHRERVFGKQHNELIDSDSISLLCLIQTQRKKFRDAEETANRAIQVLERSYGKMHPKMAVAFGRLGWLQLSMAQAHKALETLRKAASIMNNTAGENLDTARILDYLGSACTLTEDYEGAVYRKVRSLVIREKLAGSDSVDVGESLSNLAWLYGYINLPDEKMPLRRQALEIFTKKLGPLHPFTLMELSNVAHLHEAAGRYDEAIKIYEQMMDKRGELPLLNELQWSASLAYVYLQANRPRDAERVFRIIVEELRNGGSASERQAAAQNLSAAISAMLNHNLYDQAAKLVEESCRILERTERDLAKPADLIALYSGTGRYEDLIKLADEQIALKRKEAEPNLPAIASLHYAKADALISMGRFEDAEVECQDILSIVERSDGNGTLSHAAALNLMGRIHTKKNKLEDAKFDFSESATLVAQDTEKTSPIYLNYLMYRSELQVALKQYDEAIEALAEVVEKLRKGVEEKPISSRKSQLLGALRRYHDVLKITSAGGAAKTEAEIRSLFAELKERRALDAETRSWASAMGI